MDRRRCPRAAYVAVALRVCADDVAGNVEIQPVQEIPFSFLAPLRVCSSDDRAKRLPPEIPRF